MKKSIIWFAVIALCLVGLGMVTHRVLVMNGLFTVPSKVNFDTDTEFTDHPVITYLHILAGGLFVLLGPFQFMPKIRNRYLNYHRYAGWVFTTSAAVIGCSALALPFIIKPIGGFNEAVATVFFGVIFLYCLVSAVTSIIKGNTALHREWMIRTFILGLAVVTIRPINVLFFFFSGVGPQEFFGTGFWLGFSIHLLIAEWYIKYHRAKSH